MSPYRSPLLVAFLILVMTTAGVVAVTRLSAQTGTTVADAPPSLSLTVNTANPAVSGYRPGVRAYFSVSATDDKALEKVVIDTSPMMYSGQHMEFGEYYVKGKTFWEEKVYAIVPSNPGAQFVTATVTDSIGQVVTKTVNFDAPACTTDADCGGGSVQWSGTPSCGLEGNDSLVTKIMQWGVDATCKSGGICDTSSLRRLKQKCAEGQVCTDANYKPTCIAKPADCIPGEIFTTCTCGYYTITPPSYGNKYCCRENGVSYLRGDSCPPPPAPVSSSPASSVVPKAATGSTTSSPVAATGGTIRSQITAPAISPSVPVSSGQQSPGPSLPSITLPAISHPGAQRTATGRVLPFQRTATGGHAARPSSQGEAKQLNAAEVHRETQLLKSRGKQTSGKIKSIEKKIASLEKKIDAKLRLLDRAKSADVRKRLSVQVDKWQEQLDALEGKKEKLEQQMEDLRASFERLKAAAE